MISGLVFAAVIGGVLLALGAWLGVIYWSLRKVMQAGRKPWQ